MTQSFDEARSFAPRRLVSQETVRGTPLLAPGGFGAIAFWEAAAETKMGMLSNRGGTFSIAKDAELPAGVVSNGKLFVAYLTKDKEKRSVWLTKV